jgi:hypothetical protein
MKLFTIVSPDKLSISMFTNFLQTNYGENVELIDINHLNSSEIKEAIVNELLKKYGSSTINIIIRYKLKPKMKIESIDRIIPGILLESSDYIVSFDLYSQHPIIIKDKDNSMPNMMVAWDKAIQALNV